MKDFLHHLFLPCESNNHRAKVLHHQSIFFVIIFLLIGQFFLSTIKTNYPYVLGNSTDISSQELLLLINQKRQEEGLPSLILSDQLSQVAYLKTKDMFAKNYWAHNAPDGVTPWFFFKRVGYDYIYAGENLARGFTNSTAIINAWMASSTHRENILSSRYQDVGFAIMQGRLLGENTTLVVEMFGSKSPATTIASIAASTTSMTKPQSFIASIKTTPFIDSSTLSKEISLATLLLFIFILILDMIITSRKKIVRLVGHNIDHIFFLVGILIFVIIFSKGLVL